MKSNFEEGMNGNGYTEDDKFQDDDIYEGIIYI